MCKCILSGEELPERNSWFSGWQCKHKNRLYCKYYSHHFIDGTNCMQLRRPIDVRAILGVKKQ